MQPEILVKVLDRTINPPSRAHETDAGIDLRASYTTRILPHETAVVPLNAACAIPAGYVGLLCVRSGIARKRGLAMTNGVGVIDADYRGPITALLLNTGNTAQTVERGERIAQLVVVPCLTDYRLTDELGETERGAGGFGSTGVM